MDGHGPKPPDDRAFAPTDDRQPAGTATTGAVATRSEEAPAGVLCRIGAWFCRAGAAVFATVRAVVRWCLGSSSWERGAPGRYWHPAWSGGAPMPLPETATLLADPRRVNREVRRLLGGLGATPGDVAAALYAAGARGVRCDAARSPVGVYLTAIVGADPEVAALALRTDAVGVYVKGYTSPTVVPFPGPVRDFVAAFNARCYPILVEGAQQRPDR